MYKRQYRTKKRFTKKNKQNHQSEREKKSLVLSALRAKMNRGKKNKNENNIGLSHFIATECICCFIYDNLLIKQNINGEISIVWLPGILLKPDTIENH